MLGSEKDLIRIIKGAKCDHMSEELPFKSIKITLSEEALDMLEEIKRRGCFRSYSMAIEESIRALFDVLNDLDLGMRHAKDGKPIPDEKKLEVVRDVAVRLSRFSVYKYVK